MSYDPADFASPLTTCADCQDDFATESMREDDSGDLLCVSCFDDYARESADYGQCQECDEHFHKDDLVPVQGYGILCSACAKCVLPGFEPQPRYHRVAA
jgi:formylmethanofuran dehydrogenase subunit E